MKLTSWQLSIIIISIFKVDFTKFIRNRISIVSFFKDLNIELIRNSINFCLECNSIDLLICFINIPYNVIVIALFHYWYVRVLWNLQSHSIRMCETQNTIILQFVEYSILDLIIQNPSLLYDAWPMKFKLENSLSLKIDQMPCPLHQLVSLHFES